VKGKNYLRSLGNMLEPFSMTVGVPQIDFEEYFEVNGVAIHEKL